LLRLSIEAIYKELNVLSCEVCSLYVAR